MVLFVPRIGATGPESATRYKSTHAHKSTDNMVHNAFAKEKEIQAPPEIHPKMVSPREREREREPERGREREKERERERERGGGRARARAARRASPESVPLDPSLRHVISQQTRISQPTTLFTTLSRWKKSSKPHQKFTRKMVSPRERERERERET